MNKGLWKKLDGSFKIPPSAFPDSTFLIMKKAIKEYLDSKPPIPYEMELQSKLNRVRRIIQYNETWYTPTFEELREGDELEILSSWGWVAGKWPSILWRETHVNMASSYANDNSVEFRFKNCTLRKRRK